jgi:hypothetical protein
MKITAKKWNGNDKYSWAIFISGKNKPIITGLAKSEIPFYKKQIQEKILKEKINIDFV